MFIFMTGMEPQLNVGEWTFLTRKLEVVRQLHAPLRPKKAEAARKAEFKKADAQRYARKHPVDMLFDHCPQTHVYDEYRMIFKQEGVDMYTIKKGLGPYYPSLGVQTGLHRDQIDHGVEKLMIKLKEMGL